MIADQTYYVGQLGFFKRLQWMLDPYLPNNKPWLAVLAAVVVILLLLWLIVALLRLVFGRRDKAPAA